jgi:hypothetical protein
MKIQPSNKRDVINRPISVIEKGKPSEISDEEWEEVKEWSQTSKDVSKLQAQVKDTAYRRFYQEYTFREIADWLSVDIGKVIFTAISENWFSKVKSERRVRGSSSMEKTDKAQKELLHGIMDATLCVYERQLKRAMEDPDVAAECGLIPKNLKELQTLMSMVQSMQSKEIPKPGITPSTVTTINVQNLMSGNSSGGAPTVATRTSEVSQLSAPSDDNDLDEIIDTEEEEEDALSILLKAKNGV